MAVIERHLATVERTVRWSIPVDRHATSGVVPDLHTGTDYRPRVFRPARVILTRRQMEGHPPEVSVTVAGPIVKKDGTPGFNEASRFYAGVTALTDMPDWLASLVVADLVVEVTTSSPAPTDNPHGYHRPTP